MKTSHLLQNAQGITAIGRHSIKGKTRSGLTPEGKGKAAWAGRNLPSGFKVSARSGELPRQRMTARLMVNEYRGEKEMRIPVVPELGFQWIRNMPEVEKMVGQKGDAGVLAEWIDGKIPAQLMADPRTTGEAILKSAIQETQRLMKASEKRPFALNASSSWWDAAMLHALGIDYRKVAPKKLRARNPPKQGDSFKETEAILFFHMPNRRIILSWRGRKFDVTEKLETILEKKPFHLLPGGYVP